MQRFRDLAEVWRQLRRLDPKASGWVLLATAAGLAAGAGLGFTLSLWAIVPVSLLTGLLSGLVVFNLRARRAMYGAIEGQLGAAAAVLDQMRGAWFVTPAVAMNGKQDLVHRVVGRPGVVLVGEGAPQRVRGLLAQERKRLSRAVGDAPIHTIVVGSPDVDGADVVPLDPHVGLDLGREPACLVALGIDEVRGGAACELLVGELLLGTPEFDARGIQGGPQAGTFRLGLVSGLSCLLLAKNKF
jgi:hypothetical protein